MNSENSEQESNADEVCGAKVKSEIGNVGDSFLSSKGGVEEEVVEGDRVRRKGVYLLPNLLTTGSLFSGFYAIVAAMNGQFDNAAVAIFVSMVLDGLDGRVARMTNTQSDFGAQYDSLSDMVAFGVAPALVAFTWALSDLGKLGWVAAFIYVAGAALRLARFNTQIGSVDKRYFVGLASPSAAAVVAGSVWAFSAFTVSLPLAYLTVIIVAGSGVLMVSNILYYSFKELDLKGRVPFVAILIVVLIYAVVATAPAQVLLVGFTIYALSGPVQAINRWLKKRS
jgi:CDP-diacylglycerol---serine O-phosphatidyltransferase